MTDNYFINWLDRLSADRRLTPYEFRVAAAIMFEIREAGTASARMSDESISALGGGGCTRHIKRSRNRLRETGWLTWEKKGGPFGNVYKLADGGDAAA